MIEQYSARYRKAFLMAFALIACGIGRKTMVQSFQHGNCNNLHSANLGSASGLPAQPNQLYHQRPLRFKSLVLIGDYETRPILLPTTLPEDDLKFATLSPPIDVDASTQSPSVPSSVADPTISRSSRNSNNPTPPSSSSGTEIGTETARNINNRHSSGDWLYNLWTIPHSSVLREIKNPVLTLAGWATAISILHGGLSLSPGHALWASRLCIPHAAHSFLVSSLGLLLVFRTNSAYQRFQVSLLTRVKVSVHLGEHLPSHPVHIFSISFIRRERHQEARKIWEQIHTVARNLSRFTMLYRPEVGTERLNRIQNLIASFPYLLRFHVRSGCLCRRDEDNIPPESKLVLRDPSLQRVDSRYEGDKSAGGATRVTTKVGVSECFVDRRDLPWSLLDDSKNRGEGDGEMMSRRRPVGGVGNTLECMAKATNRPLWVCDRLGREIMGIPYGPHYSSRERLAFLSSVDKLTRAIGECERIHQTSVPLNYARHALRSLTIWLFSLPFCLVSEFGLLTGPVTALIAWLLFGVYQIGHSIEDPFQGSLRLSVLCDAIHKDVIFAGNGYHGVDESSCSSIRGSAFDVEDEIPHDQSIRRIVDGGQEYSFPLYDLYMVKP
jgi:predicted membrane chloride channel (bestrophin family)